MFGVLAREFPKQEKSPHPISSMRTITTFGLEAPSASEIQHATKKKKDNTEILTTGR
jgi:hypothetical protein